VAIFKVSRGDLERVSHPFSRRESGPAVRSPCRWMRAPIHIYGPVQRPHELHVVHLDVPRQRILLLENARATESAPLMGGGVRPARIFRCSPDGFGGSVGSHAASVIEGNPEIIAQCGLSRAANLAG